MNISGPGQAVESVFIGPVGHFFFIEIQGLAEKFFPVQDFSQGQPGRRHLCGLRVIFWGRFTCFGIPVQNLPVPPFGLGPVAFLKSRIPHAVEGSHGEAGGALPVGFSQPGQGLHPVLMFFIGGTGEVDINDPFNGTIRPWGIGVSGDDGKINGCHCGSPAHAATLPGFLKQGFRFQFRHEIRHCPGPVQK